MGIREELQRRNTPQKPVQQRPAPVPPAPTYEEQAPDLPGESPVDLLDIWRENLLLMRANRVQDILVIDRMVHELEEVKRNAP